MSPLGQSSKLSKSETVLDVHPIRYLPEETAARVTSNWKDDESNGAHTNGDAHAALTGHGSPFRYQSKIDALPEPWRDLYRLEQRSLAIPRDSRGKFALSAIAVELASWLESELTSAGLVKSAAADTPAVIPVLLRLREALRKRGWKKEHERALKAVFRQSCQLAIPDGWLLGPDSLSAEWRKMLKGAWRVEELGSLPEVLYRLQRGKKWRQRRPLGVSCEDSGLAAFHGGFRRKDAKLALDFSHSTCSMDLRVFRQPILRGDWETSVVIDGAPRPIHAPWTTSCWHADDDGQFLELRCEADGVVLDRQIFLCRRAPILFLVDAVHAKEATHVELAWKFSSPAIRGLKGLLPSRAQKCEGVTGELAILPFGLPSDPLARTSGHFRHEDGKLSAGAQRPGRVAVLPMAIVWGSTAKSPMSWRPLTITSDRRLVGPEEAVAWRIAAAGQQLVYFRSMLGTHRLAFLGHQTFYETIIGPVDKKGDLEHWLMVDATPDEPLPH